MRDRLIELIGKELLGYASWNAEMTLAGIYSMPSVEEVIADKILADGWMRPPLVMGDKVWIIDWCNEVNEYEVTHIRYNKDLNGQQYSYDAIMTGKNGADIGFYDSDIGKYVFLSREEAEKALKGKEDE